jgi:hypothetical protein
LPPFAWYPNKKRGANARKKEKKEEGCKRSAKKKKRGYTVCSSGYAATDTS